MCDAKIRPMSDTTELQCDRGDEWHVEHSAVLHDYAFPGSITRISWFNDDRRTFRGEWAPCTLLDESTPGAVEAAPDASPWHPCTLPAGHHGNCAP